MTETNDSKDSSMKAPSYQPKLDEAGAVETKDGFPVWVDEDGNESAFDVNDLSMKVLAANAESKKRKQRLRDMEERLAHVKDIEDLGAFLEEAEKNRDAVRALSEKDVRKVETVDKIKAEMKDGFKAKEEQIRSEFKTKLEQLQQTVEAKDAQIRKLLVSNKFAASDLFSGSEPITTLPPGKAEACYGHHFKVEELDGEGVRLVAYYNGEPIYSRERVGEHAEFDEAIQRLIDLDPDRDRILRATGGGTGAGGGTAGTPGRKDDLKTLVERRDGSENPAERIALTREIHQRQMKQILGT